jgi:hypothetical protein
VEETPELDRFYRDNQDSVNFLLLAVQDSEDDVRETLAASGAQLPVLMDDGAIASSYRVTGVPTSWSVTPDGRLAQSKIGGSSAEDLEELAQAAGAQP